MHTGYSILKVHTYNRSETRAAAMVAKCADVTNTEARHDGRVDVSG